MWRVYLLEFIVVLIITLMWVHILDKHKDDESTDAE
jgi:hypothetical protein